MKRKGTVTTIIFDRSPEVSAGIVTGSNPAQTIKKKDTEKREEKRNETVSKHEDGNGKTGPDMLPLQIGHTKGYEMSDIEPKRPGTALAVQWVCISL